MAYFLFKNHVYNRNLKSITNSALQLKEAVSKPNENKNQNFVLYHNYRACV